MKESMSITSSTYASALLTLPWDTPLEQWPDALIAALPRGISRHIVRFVGINRGIVAVKEIGARTAHHEYKMLRELQRLGAPSVRPVAVITGRHPAEEDYGELTAALVTEHLEFSLPYREIFSRHLTVVEAEKLIRALSVLLVRMHLLNFYWGDVSLSNTLFRRDAETYSAYLVDAETGEFQPNLSESRRLYDVDIARVNIIGELMDLQAGECLDGAIDVIALGSLVESSYLELWTELTAEEAVDASEYWRVSERIDRLNQLGFDVGELKVTKDDSRQVVRIRPVVVDPGHYRAELLSLTGLSVEEHQAQRLLGSIQAYQAVECGPHVGLTQAAHLWMTHEYEPTIAAVPEEMLDKLEPAQIFHEIVDHRWFLAQERGEAVTLAEATASYLASVLPARRAEARLLNTPPADEDLS
ncbi:DUF4032 domain-containing protein [Corynebacterium sp. HMSC034H07]|uniref:DUF4032 domain-containing protein n=1 Tax=Corynebacterium sp. HMSC034H07 TaxID=1739512 RepID=UPI0008A244B7|nr:DUF4032 domain-containing protein [Corynebacterium sp. HMSC034H07]OFO94855.1 lipopolysaccharide kinase [Corynebacterium sp. HMSC034H07]